MTELGKVLSSLPLCRGGVPESHRLEIFAQYQLINARETWAGIVIIYNLKDAFILNPLRLMDG